ncbi:methyltransferase domain-containing protein [Micromonospora sp. WMMD1082]|uniref:class I SAM-dependent methyltransferase n=1 Tax=Micromonospora sp. WMMD1082 TaxID=3016104 RepID=UPI0024178656|nr:methyltransferase domain-containing protein [Micromonospora sp. WMMD1082]MDG4795190.1 methyltransferase domain-containing protein [Micromonospora sp. WMMD1082]
MIAAPSHYRFRSDELMQLVYDPFTCRDLSRVGVWPGQRVMDIGAGAGSITRFLAERVGVTGRVIAVDDTRLLDTTDIVDVHQRDLRAGLGLPIMPGTVDLVHARNAWAHLPNPVRVVDEAITLLRPGGWLVLGDIIHGRVLVHRAPSDADLIVQVIHAILATVADGGVDLRWGEKALAVLLDAGMRNVYGRSRAETWSGGGPGCLLMAAHAAALRDQLLRDDLTAGDLKQFGELMVDPGVVVEGYRFASTIAQRPQ